MREIEFRGISVSDNAFVYGCLIKKRSGVSEYMIQDENGLCSDVITDTIGQYVGLKDKNGVKIYEWDIVIAEWRWLSGKVVDLSYEANFLYEIYEYVLEDVLEIIGNVHENPDLIK